MESGKIKADYTGIHISNKNRVTKRGREVINIAEATRPQSAPTAPAPGEGAFGALYDHALGRCLLRPLVSPWFSNLGGRMLNTRLSAFAVAPFVRANQIDLTMCEKRHFTS